MPLIIEDDEPGFQDDDDELGGEGDGEAERDVNAESSCNGDLEMSSSSSRRSSSSSSSSNSSRPPSFSSSGKGRNVGGGGGGVVTTLLDFEEDEEKEREVEPVAAAAAAAFAHSPLTTVKANTPKASALQSPSDGEDNEDDIGIEVDVIKAIKGSPVNRNKSAMI